MYNVLIVDDDPANRLILEDVLEDEYNTYSVASGVEALEAVKTFKPDLILLDVLMPDMQGYEVAERISASPDKIPPIIFVTALRDEEVIQKAFDSGGVDYIAKPFLTVEVLKRVAAHTKLNDLIHNLDNKIDTQTIELNKLNESFVLALEKANLYNDNDTGNHIKRVSEYSYLLAKHYGLSLEECTAIRNYASLHDIGKVAVPSDILNKPGKLTGEEFEIIKTHSYYGFKIIDQDGISEVAKNIVHYHHEKYDGSGYPQGLKADEIPSEAQVVAMADVFDALTNKRVYKDAFSMQRSISIIKEASGSHFDPELVGAFERCLDDILKIFEMFED
ncbi:MAG: response regulator [Fibrobacterales bacterium]